MGTDGFALFPIRCRFGTSISGVSKFRPQRAKFGKKVRGGELSIGERDGNGQSLDWGRVVCLRRRLRLLGRAYRVVFAKIPRAP